MRSKYFANNNSLKLKIFLACTIMALALIIPSLLVQNYVVENSKYLHLIKAVIVASIVLIGILLLRKKLDKGFPVEIGLGTSKSAFTQVLIGMGLILIPVILTLLLSAIFEWTNFTFNINLNIVLAIGIGLLSTLFTDALTEELIFRGYIYSNLKAHFNDWISSAITLLVFVISPILIISIQESMGILSGVPLSGGYIITLIFFGAFMQYLRIIFGTIWAGVGFHLVFVHMNAMMGVTSDKLLQFSEQSDQLPIQITLVSFLVLTFVCLILYPIIKKRKNKMMIKIKID